MVAGASVSDSLCARFLPIMAVISLPCIPNLAARFVSLQKKLNKTKK